MRQIFIGIIAEGSTDYRFFEPILTNTLIEIAFECTGEIDLDVKIINTRKGLSFNDWVLNSARKGFEDYGIDILVIHADADDRSNNNTYQFKIHPAIDLILQQDPNSICTNILPLVPIAETESWMLADKNLLKRFIGTVKSDSELDISGNPENFSNPKAKIENAIRIGRIDMSKKLKESLNISDLYSIIGQSLDLDKLHDFSSFQDFKENIRESFRRLNLLN